MYQRQQITFTLVRDDNEQQVKDEQGRYLLSAASNCPICNEMTEVIIDGNAFVAYANNARPVQAFSRYPQATIEFFISGICDTCWDELFAPDDPATSHQQDYQEDED